MPVKRTTHEDDVDLLFHRALALKKEGRIDEALRILLKITKMYPNYGRAFGLAGAFYWKKRDFHMALQYSKQAVVLLPKWELASIGVFQSYLALGDRINAMKEMKRFLKVKKSAHYSEFLKDLAEVEVDEQKRSSLLKLSKKYSP